MRSLVYSKLEIKEGEKDYVAEECYIQALVQLNTEILENYSATLPTVTSKSKGQMIGKQPSMD